MNNSFGKGSGGLLRCERPMTFGVNCGMVKKPCFLLLWQRLRFSSLKDVIGKNFVPVSLNELGVARLILGPAISVRGSNLLPA